MLKDVKTAPSIEPAATGSVAGSGAASGAVGIPGALAEFVEEFGLAMDVAGLPRAAGRLFGWLLVCDPPQQTAAELSAALQSSSGGVSQNLRMLMQFNFVERLGRPGDRRAFYQVAPGAWERVLASQHADTIRFRELGEQGLVLLAGAPETRQTRLAEMTDFYAFLEQEMPALLVRYRDQKVVPRA